MAALILPVAAGAYADEPGPQPVSAKYVLWHLAPTEGTTPEQAASMERTLRSFFEKKHGRLLMDGMTMDSLLLVEGNEKFLRCGVGPGCLSGLGEVAGVPWIIAGEVQTKPGRTRVQLVLVDQQKKTVLSNTYVEGLGAMKAEQLEELDVAMFEPERYRGNIELSCAVAGAEVLFDGRKVGVTPLVGPLANLPAGVHRIDVRKPGNQTFSRMVRIPIGETRNLIALLPEDRLLMEQLSPSLFKNWMFWTFTGCGLVSVGLAILANQNAVALQDEAISHRNAYLREWRDLQDRADSRYLQAYIAYGVGGAFLLGAGVVAVIDLIGRGDGGRSGAARLRFDLVPSPNGISLSATWRF